MAEELKTVTLEDVEVLRVGTFNAARGGRQTFTAKDLDELVAAHAALVADGHYPTVYLGHNPPEGSDLPEPPAVGRIVELRRKGDRLLSKLTDVPVLVAKLMAAKAYGTRSIEGMRTSISGAVKIGDQKFRQVITGLALLGKSLPAVSGLADVEKLYAQAEGSDAGWVDVPLQMAAGDDEDPVGQALSALDSWAELAMELIKGRKFAPALRQRVRMLKEDFRRIAAGPTTVEAQMDLRKALKLGADASDGDVTAALVALAGAADPATAMAVIAEILGMPDADPTAIVAKVRELAGGGAADPEAEGGGEAPAMSSKKLNPDPALDPGQVSLQALETKHTELLARLARIEGERARDAAAAAVDGAIKAGRFVPAQRESLVSLALHDMKAFETLADATPVSLALGEKGSAGRPDAADLEPTEAEVKVMMAAGFTREDATEALRMKRAQDGGVEYTPKKKGA